MRQIVSVGDCVSGGFPPPGWTPVREIPEDEAWHHAVSAAPHTRISRSQTVIAEITHKTKQWLPNWGLVTNADSEGKVQAIYKHGDGKFWLIETKLPLS